jgi:FtsH-binding integral membrane protein
MNNDILVNPEEVALEQQRFITKVYGWMALALAITGTVALFTASSPTMIRFIFANPAVFIGLLIVKLLLVGSLAGWVRKMSVTMASTVFLVYSILTGFVFASVFLMYTAGSIASTFLITGGIFAIMSAYGYFTGNDLTRFGSLLIMLLVGLIIASVINWFMHSETLYWITTYAGVFIFTGLIAYDTQKIKDMGMSVGYNGEVAQKVAILGALSLYLDFINLFVMLLRIFGRRR